MRRKVYFFLLSLIATSLTFAHGLLLKLDSGENHITGTAYFTNGETAPHQEVEMIDLDTSGSSLTALTDANGQFKLPAISSHRYRVSIFGEEGHEIHMEIIAGEKNKGQMIEDINENYQSGFELPAWAVIGGLLLLSLIPALWRKKNN